MCLVYLSIYLVCAFVSVVHCFYDLLLFICLCYSCLVVCLCVRVCVFVFFVSGKKILHIRDIEIHIVNIYCKFLQIMIIIQMLVMHMYVSKYSYMYSMCMNKLSPSIPSCLPPSLLSPLFLSLSLTHSLFLLPFLPPYPIPLSFSLPLPPQPSLSFSLPPSLSVSAPPLPHGHLSSDFLFLSISQPLLGTFTLAPSAMLKISSGRVPRTLRPRS